MKGHETPKKPTTNQTIHFRDWKGHLAVTLCDQNPRAITTPTRDAVTCASCRSKLARDA